MLAHNWSTNLSKLLFTNTDIFSGDGFVISKMIVEITLMNRRKYAKRTTGLVPRANSSVITTNVFLIDGVVIMMMIAGINLMKKIAAIINVW